MNLLPDYEPTMFSERARDLALFANNDREVFFYLITDAVDALSRFARKGIYDPHLALRSFQHVAKEAAVIYERAFGDEEAAERRKITCFTPEEIEEAGHRLLMLNAAFLEESVRRALNGDGML